MPESCRLYNPYLDIFKIFAAVSVCFLHYGFDGNFGKVVEALARFAVPFFFLYLDGILTGLIININFFQKKR